MAALTIPAPDTSMIDCDSEVESELSVLSRSPTPPSREHGLYTSPSSQPSDSGSPTPSSTDSRGDGPPPIKKRRLNAKMPRDTKHVDLSNWSPSANDEGLDQLLEALRTKRKIVVIAGAGISVSAGIPDFRSSTGLFKTLRKEHNLKGSGKSLFDAAVYSDNEATSCFHKMVSTLSNNVKHAQPTPFHHLVNILATEKRLLRLYTQNVDGLEASFQALETAVPLPRKGPWPKTIQLHGGLAKMVCTKCVTVWDFEPSLFQGSAPPICDTCKHQDEVRTQHAGKRSHGVGRLRPRMVLYNEHNPDDEAIGSVTRADLRTRPDCVLVVGTTLKVPGVRRIVREMCNIVRDRRSGLTAWINNDPIPSGKDLENCWDLIVKGTSDSVANHAALGSHTLISKEEVEEINDKGNPQVLLATPRKSAKIGQAQKESQTVEFLPESGALPADLDAMQGIATAGTEHSSFSEIVSPPFSPITPLSATAIDKVPLKTTSIPFPIKSTTNASQRSDKGKSKLSFKDVKLKGSAAKVLGSKNKKPAMKPTKTGKNSIKKSTKATPLNQKTLQLTVSKPVATLGKFEKPIDTSHIASKTLTQEDPILKVVPESSARTNASPIGSPNEVMHNSGMLCK